MFESKSKYQTRINESINTVFEEIQVELSQKQNKLNYVLEIISQRDSLAGSLGIDTAVYSVEQVDKILAKYKDDMALVEELLHSYAAQKKALISQIKETANEVNIDYRYAMQNLLVLA